MDEAVLTRWQKFTTDPLLTFNRMLSKIYTVLVSITYPFASCGRRLSIHRTLSLYRPDARQISLGNSVTLMKDVWLNIVPTSDDGVKIKIGDRCIIGLRNTISAKNQIHLEPGVITAASVVMADHTRACDNIEIPIMDQGSTPGGRITIESGCWIGHCTAIICNGGHLVIGRNSVIGANSVVARSIPPYSVVLGNPARIVKRFDVARGEWITGSPRAMEPDLIAQ